MKPRWIGASALTFLMVTALPAGAETPAAATARRAGPLLPRLPAAGLLPDDPALIKRLQSLRLASH